MAAEVSNDIVAGFEDGTVRLLQYGKSTTNMRSVFLLVWTRWRHQVERQPIRDLVQNINLKTFLSPCIILLQALRPHGERVTAVKQSPDLSMIATGSSDKTIFIFNKQQKGLCPIGFVQATGSVIDFIWRDDKTILAWCSNHTGRDIHNTSIIWWKFCEWGIVINRP